MMQSSAVCLEEEKRVQADSKRKPAENKYQVAPALRWHCLDIYLAGLVLLIGLPFLFIIALAIKMDSPGPALFKQRRLGLGGEEFCCYKFRSMYWRQSGLLETYLLEHHARGEEWRKYAKLKDDPRITKIGRLLRRFSLDELPQLINVIKGEMRLIGPRPYLPSESGRMGEYAEVILSVRPGLSGPWQVSGRNEIDFAERLEIDAGYAKQHSPLTDLIILWRTLPAVLNGRGAY